MLYSQELLGRLRSIIVGQDLAVREMVRSLTLARANVSVGPRPLGAYLFLGPTGVGKTALAAAVARELYGRSDLVVPIHLASIQNALGLIETLGFHIERCGGINVERDGNGNAIRHCQSVIVIADAHEAADEVVSLVCHLLDHGRIELGGGDVLDFSRTMFVLELGMLAEQVEELNRASIGFQKSGAGAEDQEELDEHVYQIARRSIESLIPIELLGRIDRVIVFRRLRAEHLPTLLARTLETVTEAFRSRGLPGVTLELSPELGSHLVEKATARLELGARPLLRGVRKYVIFPVADLMVSGQLPPNARLLLGIDAGHPVAQLVEMPAIEGTEAPIRLLPRSHSAS